MVRTDITYVPEKPASAGSKVQEEKNRPLFNLEAAILAWFKNNKVDTTLGISETGKDISTGKPTPEPEGIATFSRLTGETASKPQTTSPTKRDYMPFKSPVSLTINPERFLQ